MTKAKPGIKFFLGKLGHIDGGWFAPFGDHQFKRMTNEEAWSVLEDALDRCREERDLQTAEVYSALKHLSAQAHAVPGGTGVHWPFRLFWEHMAAPKDSVTFRAEGRWQQANAALRGMRLRVPES